MNKMPGDSLEYRLERRLKFEAALSECSRMLLNENNSKVAINKAILKIRSTSGACYISIFENYYDKDETFSAKRSYLNCDPYLHDSLNTPITCNFSYAHIPNDWKAMMLLNKSLQLSEDSIPISHKEFLSSFNAKTLLLLPIFVLGNWFGIAVIADTNKCFHWNDEDILILKTALGIIGTHISINKI